MSSSPPTHTDNGQASLSESESQASAGAQDTLPVSYEASSGTAMPEIAGRAPKRPGAPLEKQAKKIMRSGNSEEDPGSSGPPRLAVPQRDGPTAVQNRNKIMRVPVGNDKKTISWRDRILEAINSQIHMPIADDQVRLLVIRPGDPHDEINVTLMPIADRDLGVEYQYEALSYHWGEGEADKVIFVDKWSSKPINNIVETVDFLLKTSTRRGNKKEDIKARKHYIRENLYEALRNLRHPENPTPLWVDALCINQNDEVEKTKQVRKMGLIYHKAERVCIWLGLGDVESHRAMDFIKKVIDEEALPELLSKAKFIPQWICLYRLLEWSWFTRRWVIQELALARQASVHCGEKHAHWNDFRDAIGIFYRYFDELKYRMRNHDPHGKPISELEFLGAQLLVDLSSNVFRTNDDGTFQSTKSLEMLVSQLAGFDTADPRDTIHALRNISREGYGFDGRRSHVEHPMPETDYSQDLFEVYQKFVKWTIKTSGSLDIICRHWALPERKEAGPITPYLIESLPSWINTVDKAAFGRGADQYRGRRAGESFVGLPGKNIYAACGRKPPEVTFGEYVTGRKPRKGTPSSLAPKTPIPQDTSLTARGRKIGRINAPTISIPDGVIPQSCLAYLGWTEEHSNLTAIDEVPDKLWRTLVADRGPKGDYAPTYYHRACLNCLVNQTVNGHLNVDKQLSKAVDKKDPSIVKDYLERVLVVTWNRSIIQAESLHKSSHSQPEMAENLVGLGPPKAMEDDIIAILYGCSVPVVLRPVDSTKRTYELVGESFIHGKMDGEAMQETRYEDMDFKII